MGRSWGAASSAVAAAQQNPARRRRTRRGVLAGGAGAGLLGLACGQAPITAAPPQSGRPKRSGTYIVRVQVWGDLRDRLVYEDIMADYNAAHADIKIENDHQPAAGPGVPTYYDALVANLAAGTAADLTYFQGRSWQEFAGKGALQPLDELAARDKWSTPWPNGDAYDLQTTFRGKRYLSPSNSATMVMFYVKEYFDALGLSYPKETWTYTEFQDLCRRLTRQVDGRQVYAYQWNGTYLRNTPWWRMNGHLEWDRIAEPRKAQWNAGAVIEAFQYQLYDSQYKLQFSPMQQLLDADATYNRLEFGGVAMKVEGPWFLPRMWGPQAKREGGTLYDVQLLPRGKAKKTPHMNLLAGQGMTKMSKDKEASWDVMKWIGGESGQKRIAEGGRMCNVPDAIRKFWLPAVKSKYNVANAEAFVKAIDLGTINLVAEVTETAIDRDAGLGQAIAAIRDGKLTARVALDQVQPKIQQVLDHYWATQGSGK